MAELGGELMRRRTLGESEVSEVAKEWVKIQDMTLTETSAVLETPSEAELSPYTELFIAAETYTVTKDGAEVTTTVSARPVMPDYTSEAYGYGRISNDINNSIGKTSESRLLNVYVQLIGNKISGYADNGSYAINSHNGIKSVAELQSMPRIRINNQSGYHYKAGTRFVTWAR